MIGFSFKILPRLSSNKVFNPKIRQQNICPLHENKQIEARNDSSMKILRQTLLKTCSEENSVPTGLPTFVHA